MKTIIFAVIASIFFTNCATNNLTIRVTEPAPVNIHASVKTVGIVNRTDNDQRKIIERLDDITKLGLGKTDSLTAAKAIDGLYDGLVSADRFDKTLKLGGLYLKNDIRAAFSSPLNQTAVQDICRRNKLDALIVLEYLDTETNISTDAVKVKRRVAGVEVEIIETEASADTRIRLGWRVYSANGTQIFDERRYTRTAKSAGRGVNPMRAISAITGHQAVVETTGYGAGQDYANSMLPYTRRVSRIYYVKGTQNFKTGKRLARAGRWNDAADYWQQEVNNPKRKIAGRAHYNMAIINEINGDINDAIDWAEKAYTLYNNKKALKYLRTLRARLTRLERLRQQTDN